MLDNSHELVDQTTDIMWNLHVCSNFLNRASEYLRLYKEPVLSANYKDKAYRLIWSRYLKAPAIIRIEKRKRKVFLYWKIENFNKSDSSKSLFESEKKLAARHWKKFEKSLQRIEYWLMNPMDKSRSFAAEAAVIFEAAVDGKYKVVRRTPPIYPKFLSSLRYLIDLTDLKLEEEEQEEQDVD